MYSLIAEIAQKHGIIQKENLASEIFAEILDTPNARPAFCQSLSIRFALALPAYYKVGNQKAGEQSRGIPDVWILDDDGNALLIIECKFYAKFTWYQLNKYLDEVALGGMLLFLVPKPRLIRAFKYLLEQFRFNYPFCDVAEDRPKLFFSIMGKRVACISWDDMLNDLIFNSSPSYNESQKVHYSSDIDQLRRFCDVAENENFDPLSKEQIQGSGIPKLIRQSKCLTESIIQESLKNNVVQEIQGKANRLGAGADTSLFFGQDVMIGETRAWIGFWAAAWEELHASPLWVALYKNNPTIDRRVNYLRIDRRISVVEHSIAKDTYYFTPILVADGSQEQAIELACGSLRKLRSAMDDFAG